VALLDVPLKNVNVNVQYKINLVLAQASRASIFEETVTPEKG
jgi:hypothetical protein